MDLPKADRYFLEIQGANSSAIVYVNGKKDNDALVTGTTYELSGLNQDTSYKVEVYALDAKGNRKWNNNFNLTIEAVPREDGKVPEILPELPPRTAGEYKVRVPLYASSAPGPEDTLEFTYTPNPAKSPELRMTWKILGADLVK